MPYIEQKMRDQLNDEIGAVARSILQNNMSYEAGSSDYYALCCATAYAIYEISRDVLGLEVRYAKINDVIGALECCKMEFLRRYEHITYSKECLPNYGWEHVSGVDIIQTAVHQLVKAAEKIEGYEKNRAGILNYIMTCLCLHIIEEDNGYSMCAQNIADILGDVKGKIYTGIAVPYEEKKTQENGDVF